MAHIDLGVDEKVFPGIAGPMRYRPETARPLNELAEVLLRRQPHPLTPGERELIAAHVSGLNQCTFCCSSHSALAAAQLPDGMGLVDRVHSDVDSAPIPAKLRALLRIAAVVREDARQVTPALVAAAQDEGATDLEIHDTVLIAAAFCMFNRYVDGLATLTPTDRPGTPEALHASSVTGTGFDAHERLRRDRGGARRHYRRKEPTLPIVCVDDYRALARERIAAHNWDYIEGGSGAELTVDANRKAFDEAWLRPRMLVDVSSVSTALRLLGADLATPVGIAPTAFHRMAHPEGECATVRGAGSAGALHVVSMLASRTLEDVAAGATGPLWLQLYWLRDRRKLAELAIRAERAGYRALVLTVDAPQLAQRRRDLRNAFVLDADIEPVNLAAADSALQHRWEDGQSALAQHAAVSFDASITWADLAWLRGVTALPLVVKGVLTAEDARLAVEHGVDGIVVSNHGGRQLDGAVPAMVVLPEVVAAVAGRCPVLVDGSVRSGRDVFIALALGASAALVGRPVLWGLAVSGADGVADVLAQLTGELAQVMALAGRPRLADIDRSAMV